MKLDSPAGIARAKNIACMNSLRLTLCLITMMVGASLRAATRDAEWANVKKAVEGGLPQTAITNLQPILASALREKAWAEATRALAQRIQLESQIQGGKAEEAILRLETEVPRAPREMQPVLRVILGHWYHSYFQQNRWRFMNRTPGTGAPGKDITTWDLRRIFAEIDRNYVAALEAAPYLKAVPIETWTPLLPKASAPDDFRPTLYDFLVHELIRFYSSGEQAGARPEDAVDLSADAPYAGAIPLFGTTQEFLAGKPTRRTDESNAEKTLFLWRELLAFHQNDRDRSAFADADRLRLLWARETAVGESKSERFEAALRTFIPAWNDTVVGALARADLAEWWSANGKPAEAHQLASQLPASLRDSPGGRRCLNLIAQIERPELGLDAERVWQVTGGPAPGIDITYRNLRRVHFRAIPFDWETFLKKEWPRPDAMRPEHWRTVLATPVELAWSIDLPATPDFRSRTETIAAPRTLKPGFHFLVASATPDFSDAAGNVVSGTPIWVSDLAVVVRSVDRGIEGLVVDATSGNPMPNVEVQTWWLDRNNNRQGSTPARTDTNGLFRFPGLAPNNYVLRARSGVHETAVEDNLYVYNRTERIEPFQRVFLFTDRQLYRPGQTIQYKGLCIRADHAAADYRAVAQRSVVVVVRDLNGREIRRQTHRSGDNGSFAGSVTAPASGVLGPVTLSVEGPSGGGAQVQVEDYKRPKFQVTLDAPKSAPKLAETVAVPGRATAYTGAAIDAARVEYRVVRRARWPWWCWWRFGNDEEQEIAHGRTETASDGTFTIPFVARPDASVPVSEQPVFTFSVHADVTDGTGETRSSERPIQAGYTALELALKAEAWLSSERPVELTVSSASLDQNPEPTTGTVTIHRLREPATPVRAALRHVAHRWNRRPINIAPSTNDLSRIENWPLADVAEQRGFKTDTNGTQTLAFTLAPGAYKAIVEAKDRFGKSVREERVLEVVEPGATRFNIRKPSHLAAPTWTVEPGGDFTALWGTGYDSGRAFVEVSHRGKELARFWTEPGRTQQLLRHPVTESLRGGFQLRVTYIRENRAYTESRQVAVPWSNKDLVLKWDTFRSRLEPGQSETWTLSIRRKNPGTTNAALPAPAELAAALYDASLDQILPHSWPGIGGLFPYDSPGTPWSFANRQADLNQVLGRGWQPQMRDIRFGYRGFPSEILAAQWIVNTPMPMMLRSVSGAAVADAAPAPAPAAEMAAGRAMTITGTRVLGKAENFFANADAAPAGAMDRGAAPDHPTPAPRLDSVVPRKNLAETAFFFPQLQSDSNGVVRLEFKMPEALTEWRFLGFAHDRELRSGSIEARSVTAREIMVQPNPPRFLREDDIVEFTVKVSNQSDKPQRGRAALHFLAAQDDRDVNRELAHLTPEQPFDVPARQSRSLSWRIRVPDGMGFLRFKAVASAESGSDGEEGFIPVLSRRVLVTESLPLPLRGAGSREFAFDKLLQSAQSKSLRHQNVTIQMVSQPAWYAVLALPYLMEYPHECAEQTFNRLYANALAQNIANSNPKIARVFEQWRGTAALDSPLAKNPELKSVLIEETPWLRQANTEGEARRNIGVLFDGNRLRNELASAQEKLIQLQLPDGAWPWFSGGPANDYITLYIVSGFGRLRHLGVPVNPQPAIHALDRLDGWVARLHADILKGGRPSENHLGSTIALYLYARSFYLKDKPLDGPAKASVDYFLGQSRQYWVKLPSRQSQAHVALALQRFGDQPTPAEVVRSLRERAVRNEELGMFWRDTEYSWSWYHAPIETQSLMIEAFAEIAGDDRTVEDLKVWLLKLKQTQDWKTTKATADAVYALLLRGTNLLSSDALVEVKVGGLDITPRPGTAAPGRPDRPSVEPGTGFYEKRFGPGEIKPALGRIATTKRDAGVSWGSVHWQYLEDIGRVTPHSSTPLKLQKRLFKRVNSKSGPTLQPINGKVAPGDELVVRLELRTDRDMEFVHLKDQRGSGVEPVANLSSYKFQDGLGYYESPRDTASHFFIDYLPKGTYVFEYPVRVQLRGRYQSGIAEIQCLYAPEFNAHSESTLLEVQ